MRIARIAAAAGGVTGESAQYQGRVEAAPRVEQQLVSLQREYDLERHPTAT